jgi:hypothetical protein
VQWVYFPVPPRNTEAEDAASVFIRVQPGVNAIIHIGDKEVWRNAQWSTGPLSIVGPPTGFYALSSQAVPPRPAFVHADECSSNMGRRWVGLAHLLDLCLVEWFTSRAEKLNKVVTRQESTILAV